MEVRSEIGVIFLLIVLLSKFVGIMILFVEGFIFCYWLFKMLKVEWGGSGKGFWCLDLVIILGFGYESFRGIFMICYFFVCDRNFL